LSYVSQSLENMMNNGMTNIIDAHVHYFLRVGEEKRFLSAMDAAEIDRSLLVPLPPLEFKGACTAGNEPIYEVCRRHPDRLSFGVFADPREADALDTVRRFVDLGTKVLKLYPPLGFFPDDPACMPMYELAAGLKLPILSPTWGFPGPSTPGTSPPSTPTSVSTLPAADSGPRRCRICTTPSDGR